MSSQKPGSMDEYRVIRQLGSGSFGTCQLVQRKGNDAYYAIKAISIGNINQQAFEQMRKEVDIHRKMKHQNIVSYRAAFVQRGATRGESSLMIVM